MMDERTEQTENLCIFEALAWLLPFILDGCDGAERTPHGVLPLSVVDNSTFSPIRLTVFSA